MRGVYLPVPEHGVLHLVLEVFWQDVVEITVLNLSVIHHVRQRTVLGERGEGGEYTLRTHDTATHTVHTHSSGHSPGGERDG